MKRKLSNFFENDIQNRLKQIESLSLNVIDIRQVKLKKISGVKMIFLL